MKTINLKVLFECGVPVVLCMLLMFCYAL
jgi:hypothetical protein